MAGLDAEPTLTFQSNKGVWIRSNEEISVYSVNKEPKSTDAYISLPVDVLGTEYYAMTYTWYDVCVCGD